MVALYKLGCGSWPSHVRGPELARTIGGGGGVDVESIFFCENDIGLIPSKLYNLNEIYIANYTSCPSLLLFIQEDFIHSASANLIVVYVLVMLC